MGKNLLFVHDHIFTKKNGLVYSAAAFPSDSWCRYLDFFDSVKVVGRHASRNRDVGGLVLSSKDNVDFFFVEAPPSRVFGFICRRRNARKIIRSLLASSSALVARLPSENGYVAIALARQARIPIAVEVVGCALDAYNNYGGVLAKLYAPIAYYKMRRSVARASQVLYVTSEYLQNRYPACHETFKISASNVNLPSDFYPEKHLSERIFKCNEKLTLGLIGNYKTNYKGVDVAVRSVAYLRSLGLDVSLRILGAGDSSSYRLLCRELSVDEYVDFCGPLPNGRPVLEWLEKVDIYIQPSRTEGLPRSLVEAMSQGKPCFGANVGGIPELLSDSYIHRVGDPEDLGNKIIAALRRNHLKSFDVINYESSLQFAYDKVSERRYEFFKRLSNKS
ncbi:glycosyltransferase [Marinobacter sp. M5B]|uniref:glycosyltransferase n=1 Tax=Marinobacter sp. M5B TaxID=3141535 RepID=UPI0036D42EDC